MKSENEINSDILEITMTIHNKYPELSKYITEMPVTIPDKDDPKINIRILHDYYNSLQALLKKYHFTHTSSSK
jgi:hypothetical protein